MNAQIDPIAVSMTEAARLLGVSPSNGLCAGKNRGLSCRQTWWLHARPRR